MKIIQTGCLSALIFAPLILFLPTTAGALGKCDSYSVVLPSPGFTILSNLTPRLPTIKPIRPFSGTYQGAICDQHVHYDPDGSAAKTTPAEVITALADNDVYAIVMPTPNEGQVVPIDETGIEHRETLRTDSDGRVQRFCASTYISAWLHRAYRDGCDETELNEILRRLEDDLTSGQCIGIGEIGIYHFDKKVDSEQPVISYPFTYPPFLEIVNMIASYGAWLDLHAEPIDSDFPPPVLGHSYEDQVFGGLALLYGLFPDLKLILSHTAMTNTTNVRSIMDLYSDKDFWLNLKIITSHENWKYLSPITSERARLYEEWAELLEDRPGYFMVGTDYKFNRESTPGYTGDINDIRNILGSINSVAANKIGYMNAKSLGFCPPLDFEPIN